MDIGASGDLMADTSEAEYARSRRIPHFQFVSDDEFRSFNTNPIIESPVINNELPIKRRYHALDFITSYQSIFQRFQSDEESLNIAQENKYLLEQYYKHKTQIYSNKRITSRSDNTDQKPLSNKEFSLSASILDRFSVNSQHKLDLHQIQDTTDSHQCNEEGQERYTINHNYESDYRSFIDKLLKSSKMQFANSYLKYYRKLLTIETGDVEALKRHHLWIPTLDSRYEYLLGTTDDGKLMSKLNDFKEKSCPLLINGMNYVPRAYDSYRGSSLLPSLFSEYKFPALSYHCSIDLNGKIYLLGGLMASYRNNREKPDLSKFEVEGVNNLPPPLIYEIINNPAMLPNPHLYFKSTTACHLYRPELSGHIPPPLLCASASILTSRYILFYGGFELRVETTEVSGGGCHSKIHFHLNNLGYILDTATCTFTKTDIVAMQDKHDINSYANFLPRFGHMQISTPDDITCFGENNSVHLHLSEQNSSNRNQIHHPGADGNTHQQRSDPITNKLNTGLHAHVTYIFGGYTIYQNNIFEALNDMWKIIVPITAKGKRGYCKFGTKSIAISISPGKDLSKWPSARAFFGYCSPDIYPHHYPSFEVQLLNNLKENFRIDMQIQSLHSHSQSDLTSPTNSIHGNTPDVQERIKISPSHMNNDGQESDVSKGWRFANTQQSREFRQMSPLSTHNLLYGEQNKKNRRLIVIHGGSNLHAVAGDMWWFDLDTEEWIKIDTYVRAANERIGMVSMEMQLVGHSMFSVGSIVILVGGMTQKDVNVTYGGVPIDENSGSKITLGSSYIRGIDLTTQLLEGFYYDETVTNNYELELRSYESEAQLHGVMSVGGSLVQSDGCVFISGGAITRRPYVKDYKLRGCLTEIVIPSMNLAC